MNDVHGPEGKPADQKGQDGASDHGVGLSEEHLRDIDGFSLLQDGQRRRCRDCVHFKGGGSIAEGDQDKAAAGKRRV